MRPLILDDNVRMVIRKVIDYAEKNIITEQDTKEMIEGKQPPAGDNPHRVCIIPVEYRTVFSLEQHPTGLFRRISISVPVAGKVPSVPAANEIIKEFGFTDDITGDNSRASLLIRLEELGDDMQAVQIAEKVMHVEK